MERQWSGRIIGSATFVSRYIQKDIEAFCGDTHICMHTHYYMRDFVSFRHPIFAHFFPLQLDSGGESLLFSGKNEEDANEWVAYLHWAISHANGQLLVDVRDLSSPKKVREAQAQHDVGAEMVGQKGAIDDSADASDNLPPPPSPPLIASPTQSQPYSRSGGSSIWSPPPPSPFDAPPPPYTSDEETEEEAAANKSGNQRPAGGGGVLEGVGELQVNHTNSLTEAELDSRSQTQAHTHAQTEVRALRASLSRERVTKHFRFILFYSVLFCFYE